MLISLISVDIKVVTQRFTKKAQRSTENFILKFESQILKFYTVVFEAQ